MSTEFSENSPEEIALSREAFRASRLAAKKQGRWSWILSIAWLGGILAVALYFSSEIGSLKKGQDDLQHQMENARVEGGQITDLRTQIFALEESVARRELFDKRSLSPAEEERYALELAQAQVDRGSLTPSELSLLAAQRAKAEKVDTAQALYLQGSAFVTSEPPKAIEKLRAAVAKDPNYEPAWAALGRAYRYDLNYVEADKALTKAITLNPDRTFSQAERCNVRLNLNDVPSDETVMDCDHAVALDPTDWLPRHYRAFGNYRLGKDKDAEDDWHEAAKLRASPAGSLENLGLIYLRKGEWQKALDNAATVNLIDSGSAWNWLFLSIAADRLGQKSVAAEARAKWRGFDDQAAIDFLRPLMPKELQSYLTLN